MKFSIILVIISIMLATGNCTVCYQCVEGDQSNVLLPYTTCNKFLENHTCNTTSFSSRCVTHVSNYLHRRTVVYDCVSENRPFKFGEFDTSVCRLDYCNRNENWGRYNTASSVTLKTSLGLILISSLYFL